MILPWTHINIISKGNRNEDRHSTEGSSSHSGCSVNPETCIRGKDKYNSGSNIIEHKESNISVDCNDVFQSWVIAFFSRNRDKDLIRIC